MNGELVTNVWHWWVGTIGSLGLPLDRQTAAYFMLGVAFYAIGAAYKLLTQKEK
jgi:hypothetical protein